MLPSDSPEIRHIKQGRREGADIMLCEASVHRKLLSIPDMYQGRNFILWLSLRPALGSVSHLDFALACRIYSMMAGSNGAGPSSTTQRASSRKAESSPAVDPEVLGADPNDPWKQ